VIERLALDTSAAVDHLREDRQSPPQIATAGKVVVPLTVIGELFYGAACSALPAASHALVEGMIARWQPLVPTIETARIYGRIRAAVFQRTTNLSVSKKNDLWIAAL
jgi:tRNA(fMet)-specific endonuclease VapC